MINLRQRVRALTAMIAILLLCMAQAPVTMASTNATAAAQATASTSPQVNATTQIDPATHQANAKVASANAPAAAKPKSKAVTKPREKSILDADVLDSPMSYLRDAFSTEGEDADIPVRSGAVTVAVKALVASLLSTII